MFTYRREEERDVKWILMQELALPRAPRHIVRLKDGQRIDKVVNF
jgi:hypothetical protein